MNFRMVLRYDYDEKLDAFFGAHAGTLENKHLENAFADLAVHPKFVPNVRVLHDYSRVTEFKLSAQVIDRIAAAMSTRAIEGRRAFIVVTPTGFGTVNFYLKTLLKEKVRVFYDRQAALTWLNEGMPPERQIR